MTNEKRIEELREELREMEKVEKRLKNRQFLLNQEKKILADRKKAIELELENLNQIKLF